MESLESSPPCPFIESSCKIKHDWKFNHNKDTITLSGNIVQSLPDYLNEIKCLNYTKTLRLAICLGIQLGILSDYNYGILHFNIKDIMVIDENWFLLTNLSNLTELLEDNKLNIIKPISPGSYLAPELKLVKALPAKVYSSCAYYSLALLCIDVYGFDKIITDIKLDLEIIRRTPLYFLLKRCLDKNPTNRVFLLI